MYIGLYVSTCYSCQILMKIELYRHIFDIYIYIYIYIYINLSSGYPLVACRQTDGYDEGNCRFSQIFRTGLKMCSLNDLHLCMRHFFGFKLV